MQWESNNKYEKRNDIDIVKDFEKRQENINLAKNIFDENIWIILVVNNFCRKSWL